MSAIIVYKSIYGATAQYAKWIAEDLRCEAIDIVNNPAAVLSKADVIIAGGSLYAGRITVAPWLRKHWAACAGKPGVLFTVGGGSAGSVEETRKLLSGNFPPAIVSTLKHFHFEGRLLFDKLHLFHRIITKMIMKMSKTAEAKKMLAEGGYDHVDRSRTTELVQYVRSLAPDARK
jgi:menaquinone-dependent protoporphyrinogen IX oxidase